MNNIQELTNNLDDDAMWGAVDPEEQVTILSDLTSSTISSIIALKDRIATESMTQAERYELQRKLSNTKRFLLHVQARSTKARVALTLKNRAASEDRNYENYLALAQAIDNHRETTSTVDDPNIIENADNALYAALDKSREK